MRSGVPGPMPPGGRQAGNAAAIGPVGPCAASKVPADDSVANYEVFFPSFNRVSIVGGTTTATGNITGTTRVGIAGGRPTVVNGTPAGNIPSSTAIPKFRVLFIGGSPGSAPSIAGISVPLLVAGCEVSDAVGAVAIMLVELVIHPGSSGLHLLSFFVGFPNIVSGEGPPLGL